MNDQQQYELGNYTKGQEQFVEDVSPFKIQPLELEEIFTLCQKRILCEEVDYLDKKGGLNWALQGLLSSKQNGVNSENQMQRIKVYGTNQRNVRASKSYFELLWNALQDFTMKILILASIVSIVIEVVTADDDKKSTSWIEGFSILVAVIVCTNVAASNDYSKEKQFLKLNDVSDKEKIVTVIRDRENKRIHEQDLLVGDIMKVVEGMEIPADGILIEASDILIDESSMTGETQLISKGTLQSCLKTKNEILKDTKRRSEQDNTHEIPSIAILSGTRVLEGEGLMLVCVVGDQSCVGKIRAALIQEDDEVTPLQEKLTEIAEDIGKMGLASAIIIVIVLLIRFGIERTVSQTWDHNQHWGDIVKYFITGIVVLAVAIPEGLPLSVTLSLAFSVHKMMNDKNFVRKMYACETMGGADCICSDKTGTLTMNEMALTMIWNKEYREIDARMSGQPLTKIRTLEQLILQSICCNSSAELDPDKTGSSTEIALLEFSQKINANYQQYRGDFKIIQKMPFNSSRKRMSVIIDLNDSGKQRLLVKGAPEYILEGLSQYHDFNDSVSPLTQKMRDSIVQALSTMANKGLRTLCLAYRDLNGSEDINKVNGKIYEIESEKLTFLCLLGIMDTLREGVKEAVDQCREAGITVRMVTGDNKDTARAIAIQCGIIQVEEDEGQVMEGPEFVDMVGGIVCRNCQTERCPCANSQKDAETRNVQIRVDCIAKMDVFKKIYPKVKVMARSRPQDKYALVMGLKELDHVVAVTGDGTNDAPALKKADVGFAMGLTGTQVAKDAAAIILMEDNFKDIVKAVMWGRNIYQCIRKFLQFQLTVNIVAVFLTLINAAILKQNVLQPIQMLWVNLIMDSFASLALATEPPNPILLKDKPYGRKEYIITLKMVKHIVGQSIYQIIVIMIFIFTCEQWMPEYQDDFDRSNGFQAYYKYNTDYLPNLLITNGRFRSVDGQTEYYERIWEKINVPSRHFTIVFNLFVMLQVFNFFNARKLNDELNIFTGLTNNFWFISIVVMILVLQIVIVTFGGLAFSCYTYYGLHINHWLICIGFGLGGWIVAIILKFIPEEKVFCCFLKPTIIQEQFEDVYQSSQRSFDYSC